MIAVVIAAAALCVTLVAAAILRRVAQPSSKPPAGPQRILFPFVANALSRRALEAALRLARTERATLVPVFLARVPLHLPLDAPLPRQAGAALPLQEAIEQRAAAFDVAVDARIERGRTSRHALRQALDNERFDQIVMAAASRGGPGFGPEDIAWLLEHATGEIIVLRPGTEDPVIRVPDPRRAPLARWDGPAGRRGPRSTRGVLAGARAAHD
jgi:nucleotide-binding universal stress UspA family protein